MCGWAKPRRCATWGSAPIPSRSRRTHYAQAILDDFAGHEGKEVTVAGRLMSWRKQGALAFGHLQDQTGRIQLFLRRQFVQATAAAEGILGYGDLNLLDLGDVVEATGKVVQDGARRDFRAGGEAAAAHQGHPAAAGPVVRVEGPGAGAAQALPGPDPGPAAA